MLEQYCDHSKQCCNAVLRLKSSLRFVSCNHLGNGNYQKAISLLSKATILHVYHPFLVHFSAVTARLRPEKCLISHFLECVNKRQHFFLSFSNWKLENGSHEINSREIRLHLTFQPNWNKRGKVWKNAISSVKEMLHRTIRNEGF